MHQPSFQFSWHGFISFYTQCFFRIIHLFRVVVWQGSTVGREGKKVGHHCGHELIKKKDLQKVNKTLRYIMEGIWKDLYYDELTYVK